MRNCLMLFSSLMHLIKIICFLLKMTKIFKSSSSGWRKKSIQLYKSTNNKSWSFDRGTWRPMRTLLDSCKASLCYLKELPVQMCNINNCPSVIFVINNLREFGLKYLLSIRVVFLSREAHLLLSYFCCECNSPIQNGVASLS